MQKIYYDDLVKLAQAARGKIHKIYIHWTAGHYDSKFDAYHINITGDGMLYASTVDLTQILSHTWRRNTAAIGITLCCAYDAMIYADGTFTLGEEPPTQLQIESVSMAIAVLAEVLHIPLDAEHIMTHAEAADLDGYGPQSMGTPNFERWDLWKLPDYDGTWRSGGVVLRGKAIHYFLRGGMTNGSY